MPNPITPAVSTKPDDTNIVDPQTLKFRRAIKNDEEAYSIYKRLVKDNTERNSKAAAIMRKYNDEQPWNAAKLKAAGQGWRHNRSTGFMSSMIKRIVPPYKQAIDSARTLTSAQLKDNSPKAEQKNEDFRVEFTKVVRRWKGWHNFTHQLTLEDVLFGYTGGCWTDEYDWHPIFCRQDEAFFPEGSPQEASEIPLWAKKQNFLIHELADRLINREASEAAGWNVENLVLAINEAQPENRKKGDSEDQRKYEDTVRESTMGRSYTEGVKVVEAAHLFVQEYTGKVSQYLINAKTGKPLMTRLDRFDAMDQCLSLLSIEVGNGKLHGSKGAGRVLYNTHVAVEQSRNLIADALYLSSLILVKAEQKSKNVVAITVQHPVAIVGDGYKVEEIKFEVNVDAFFALDRHHTSIAELQVGAFMPGQLLDSTGEKRTASEVNYVASIEAQIREGLISRFWGQFQALIFQMQKRIYSQDNIAEALRLYKEKQAGLIRRVTRETMAFLQKIGKYVAGKTENIVMEENYLNKEAVYSCLCLLEKGLSAEDIFELAQCPPNEVTQDMATQNAQIIDEVVARYIGDKSIRQTELKKKDIASKLGNTVAEELIIPEEDQTLVVEAARMQLLEMNALLAGDPIEVSPRDYDEIHLATMRQKVETLLTGITPEAVTPESLEIAQNILAHFDAHIQSALSKEVKPEAIQEHIDFAKQIHQLIDGIVPQPMPGSNVSMPAGAAPAIDPTQMMNLPPTLEEVGAPTLPPQPIPPNQSMPLSKGPIDIQPKVTP